MVESGHPSAGAPTEGVTELLLDARSGRRDALDRLFPIVYEELRRVAHARLQREPEGHTLNTTALVHEAYIRLIDVTRVDWRDRVHFLSMAARSMRRILIDYARQHRAARRGGGAVPLDLNDVLIAADQQADTLSVVDDALEQLAVLNPRLVRVVECRYFAGMTEAETAQALDVNERTVRRDWIKARGWLRKALSSARL